MYPAIGTIFVIGDCKDGSREKIGLIARDDEMEKRIQHHPRIWGKSIRRDAIDGRAVVVLVLRLRV